MLNFSSFSIRLIGTNETHSNCHVFKNFLHFFLSIWRLLRSDALRPSKATRNDVYHIFLGFTSNVISVFCLSFSFAFRVYCCFAMFLTILVRKITSHGHLCYI